MRILTTTVLISALALGACDTIYDSVVNPVNWFGKGRSSNSAAEQSSNTNPLIQESKRGGRFQRKDREVVYLGKPIDQVTNLVIERVPGGAVIRATGLTAVQGLSLVQLPPSTEAETPINGVLTYGVEGVFPVFNESVGSTHTRTVVAARALTDQELAGVRSIRVEGASNAQTSRRR